MFVELRITRGPVSATVLLDTAHDLNCDTSFTITSPASASDPDDHHHNNDDEDSNTNNNSSSSLGNVTSAAPSPTPVPALTPSPRAPLRRVSVIWQKDGETIRRSGDNYRVRRKSGRLHFFHVRYSDRGNYRCIVQSNGVKIHSSYAKLTVHGKFSLNARDVWECSV